MLSLKDEIEESLDTGKCGFNTTEFNYVEWKPLNVSG